MIHCAGLRILSVTFSLLLSCLTQVGKASVDSGLSAPTAYLDLQNQSPSDQARCRVLFILPGFRGRAENYLDLAQSLRKSFALVALPEVYDWDYQSGPFGPSPEDESHATLSFFDWYLDAIASPILRRCGSISAVVLGHSRGGQNALRLADARGTRLSGLVLLDPVDGLSAFFQNEIFTEPRRYSFPTVLVELSLSRIGVPIPCAPEASGPRRILGALMGEVSSFVFQNSGHNDVLNESWLADKAAVEPFGCLKGRDSKKLKEDVSSAIRRALMLAD